jgi:RNA polymerase primary sigma factor
MTKKNLSGSANHQTQRTLEEIASMFDVTRERVRQIEAKALKKVRQRLISRGICHDMLRD